jgi:hypothetical protein
VFGLRSAVASAVPLAACAETMFAPGAPTSGLSQTSPDGPREAKELAEGGWLPSPCEQSSLNRFCEGGCM